MRSHGFDGNVVSVENPFEPYKPFRGGGGPPMAMDDSSSLDWAFESRTGSLNSVYQEGQTFLGFPELSLMAQRPEYRVISETIATEMTRKWIEFTTSGDDDKTEKIQQIEAEFIRLNVRHNFRKGAEHDGFFGRGHLYLDTGDTEVPEELITDLGNGKSVVSQFKISPAHPLKKLKIIEPVWTYPQNYNSWNPLRDDWYKPTMWNTMGIGIHTSRLLTFIGREVPDLLKPAYAFGGLSMSQMAKPYVDNWLRTRQSVSDIVKSFSVFVLKTSMSGVLSGVGADDFFRRLQIFTGHRDNHGVMAIDKDTEDFANVSAPIGGLDKLQAQSQEQMASVSRIPLVKLTGISPSGLNASSEGELRCFEDTIHAYQESLFRSPLTKVLHFVQLSLFGEVDPEIDFEFLSITEMTDKEKADLRQIEAMTGQVLIEDGAISQLEERQRIADDPNTPYDGLEVDVMPNIVDEETALTTGAGMLDAGQTTHQAAFDPLSEVPVTPPAPPDMKMPGLGLELHAGGFGGPGTEAGFKGGQDEGPFDPNKHPRDTEGKFATSGTSASAFHGLHEKVKSDGGFSYEIVNSSSPKPGDKKFAVAYSKETEHVVELSNFTARDITKYVKRNKADLLKPGVHLGAWVDSGKVYLDCSIVSDNEEEVRKIARTNEQLSYFSFEHMQAIDTPNG